MGAMGPGARASARDHHRLVACVAVGCIFGALAAGFDNRAEARRHLAASLGWFPDAVRDDGDVAALLEYRRDAIAAAVREWRSTVRATGYASEFDLDAGVLGAGASAFGDDLPSAATRSEDSGPRSGLREGGSDSDPLGALALTPEPSMPTDVVVDPALREVLLATRSRDRGEVMLGLADAVMLCKNVKVCWWKGGNILESFLDVTWRRLRIRNLIIAVLDDETAAYMSSHWPDVPTFRPETAIPSTQDGTHPANRVSALKYDLLTQCVGVGVAVLITDLDLVYVQNPFEHLHRDADIEGQTDGFTEKWAHGSLGGIQDKTMGWGGGGLYAQTFTINVGCMYVRPTARAAMLMRRVARKMATTKTWDQQAFNEEAMLPAHGGISSGLVSIRIMDYLRFVNSKTFFRSERARFLPGNRANPDSTPVMVHMNYHPNKHERMLCLIARYHEGVKDACDALPGGSEPGT